MADYCFKVLAQDLRSVGLLGATRLQYGLGKWIRPLEPLSNHCRKGGGLWVTRRLSQARSMRRYLTRKYGYGARIFQCKIGRTLYESSCRVKTDRVMLINEVY